MTVCGGLGPEGLHNARAGHTIVEEAVVVGLVFP